MNRFTIFLNWVDNDIFNIRGKNQVTALAIRRKGTQKTVLTRHHYLSMLDPSQLASIILAHRPVKLTTLPPAGTRAKKSYDKKAAKNNKAMADYDLTMSQYIRGKFLEPKNSLKLIQTLSALEAQNTEASTALVDAILIKNKKIQPALLKAINTWSVVATELLTNKRLLVHNPAFSRDLLLQQITQKKQWELLDDESLQGLIDDSTTTKLFDYAKQNSSFALFLLQKAKFAEKLVDALFTREMDLGKKERFLLNIVNEVQDDDAKMRFYAGVIIQKFIRNPQNSLFVKVFLRKEPSLGFALLKNKVWRTTLSTNTLVEILNKNFTVFEKLAQEKQSILLTAVYELKRRADKYYPIESYPAVLAMTRLKHFKYIINHFNDLYKTNIASSTKRLQLNEVSVICNHYSVAHSDLVQQFIGKYFAVHFKEGEQPVSALLKNQKLAEVMLSCAPIRQYIKTHYREQINSDFLTTIISYQNKDRFRVETIDVIIHDLISGDNQAQLKQELVNHSLEPLIKDSVNKQRRKKAAQKIEAVQSPDKGKNRFLSRNCDKYVIMKKNIPAASLEQSDRSTTATSRENEGRHKKLAR